MPVEALTYTEIGQRLGVTAHAARMLIGRLRLPRHINNDGRTVVQIDMAEIKHRAQPTQPRSGHQQVIAQLKERLTALEGELKAERERSAAHRADFERAREHAERLTSALETELAALRAALSAKPASWWPWRRRNTALAALGVAAAHKALKMRATPEAEAAAAISA
jgi:hypothetical protein